MKLASLCCTGVSVRRTAPEATATSEVATLDISGECHWPDGIGLLATLAVTPREGSPSTRRVLDFGPSAYAVPGAIVRDLHIGALRSLRITWEGVLVPLLPGAQAIALVVQRGHGKLRIGSSEVDAHDAGNSTFRGEIEAAIDGPVPISVEVETSSTALPVPRLYWRRGDSPPSPVPPWALRPSP